MTYYEPTESETPDKKYPTFLQIMWAIRDSRLAGKAEHHLLLILATRGNVRKGGEPHVSFPSIEALANDSGYSNRHVQRSLSRLAKADLIKVKRRWNKSSIFTINLGKIFASAKFHREEALAKERKRNAPERFEEEFEDDHPCLDVPFTSLIPGGA